MLLFGLGMGASYAAMPALIARSVATEELGSSVSFNQVLRTVGSSFGTAIAGAVLAANMGQDMHSTNGGITLTLAIGSLLCRVVFAAMLLHTLKTRWRRSCAAPPEHLLPQIAPTRRIHLQKTLLEAPENFLDLAEYFSTVAPNGGADTLKCRIVMPTV
ncbi:MFS transporter [Paeniglutamicibacter gangotriensis]|uniref:hypothetical protein n=1 Tax=Paeniglutamicibacter gangotriensis TaxID=254787 RepID=UPI0021D0B252|nr:hypothetical protein [Paeniglutamicibacter gangotriensis]